MAIVARAAVMLLTLTAAGLHAQFETATLSGTETDPPGSVIARAEVRILNHSTNAESVTSTDEEGRYFFANLRPGECRVIILSPGFKQAVTNVVTLQVNQAGKLDMQLTLVAGSEQVQVSAEAAPLETKHRPEGR
jgi:hypothetical protein